MVRRIVPIVLLIAGAASIGVGVMVHSQAVLAQVEGQQRNIPDDRPFWQQGPGPQAGPQYVATWLQESEPQLIKEVTVGGLMLTEGREIHRTYMGFNMPSLCPT
jgi:hypothetical protein